MTHYDDNYATKVDLIEAKAELKADIAEVRSEIKVLSDRVKMLTNLVLGLYVGIALLILDKFF